MTWYGLCAVVKKERKELHTYIDSCGGVKWLYSGTCKLRYKGLISLLLGQSSASMEEFTDLCSRNNGDLIMKESDDKIEKETNQIITKDYCGIMEQIRNNKVFKVSKSDKEAYKSFCERFNEYKISIQVKRCPECQVSVSIL